MIRRFSQVLLSSFATFKCGKTYIKTFSVRKNHINSLNIPIRYHFASLPRHQVLTMPALSPTMSEGKIIKWLKNVGDKVDEGDVICEIQTDKATVGFQVQDKGYIAHIKQTSDAIPVGQPVVVVVKKQDFVKDFGNYSFDGSASKSQNKPTQQPSTQSTQKKEDQPATPSSSASYPRHNKLNMPALSPTMSEGKILKWNIKQGQEFSEGDSLCDIETDKATVGFQASQKGVLAKILVHEGTSLKVGEVLAVSVKKKGDVEKFSDYSLSESSAPAAKSTPAAPEKTSEAPQRQQHQSSSQESGGRLFASPAAKTLASQKGISLQEIGRGSGPDGRIIRQDVESFSPSAKVQQTTKPTSQSVQKPASKPTISSPKFDASENPYEEIPLNNMRKTIASRLTESKTTIPHYYINCSVEMDAITALRAQLNKNQKENGVKISVNDIMVKAMALALRDYPIVNSQWHGTVVKRFKYADVSVAVATDGGLITPIVHKADTLGLLEISRRTKDIAKRAREGKLDPKEYIGGTSTISNLGMFGINTVTSVINPPQSTILGVGKTEKKIIFDENSTDPNKPYRVAEICELIVSADHRVVDGAVAAQWVTRIKKYLENPHMMLL